MWFTVGTQMIFGCLLETRFGTNLVVSAYFKGIIGGSLGIALLSLTKTELWLPFYDSAGVFALTTACLGTAVGVSSSCLTHYSYKLQ